jgi:hypothetical protein
MIRSQFEDFLSPTLVILVSVASETHTVSFLGILCSHRNSSTLGVTKMHFKDTWHKPGMMVLACSLPTWQAEAGLTVFQEFKVSLLHKKIK